MVDDWFFDPWLNEHLARHPKAGLPPADSEAGAAEYGGWRQNFVRRGVHDYGVATGASVLLQAEKLRHSSEHFPRLLEIAAGLVAARRAEEAAARRAALRAEPPSPVDLQAAAYWAARSEEERSYWRALVAARLPCTAGRPRTLELFATAWSHDPTAVVGPAPGGPPDPPDPSLVAEAPPRSTPSRTR